MIYECIDPGAPFSRVDALLELIHKAFQEQEGRLDPPSSALRETTETLRRKQREQFLVLATEDDRIRGCLFGRPRPGDLYISKLATHPDARGKGVGRALIDTILETARLHDFRCLTLEVRISLKNNHKLFSSAGFRITAARSHPGYDHPTFYEMRRAVTC